MVSPAAGPSTSSNQTVSIRRHPYQCRATELTPAWSRLQLGEAVALDIEFQNFKHSSWRKWRHRIGRVAIVNSKGDTILDVYAAYSREDGVSKMVPPARFMVCHQDLKFENGAVSAHKVERWVKQIVADRTVVLHGGKHDLTAFVIEADVFARSEVIDMQDVYSYLQDDGKPGLRTAAEDVLGESIQAVEHSPVEDAQTTMKLWLKSKEHKEEIEHANAEAQRLRQLEREAHRKGWRRYRGHVDEDDGEYSETIW